MRILNWSVKIRGLGDIVSPARLLPRASCESHQVNPVCGLIFTTKFFMLEMTRFTNWNFMFTANLTKYTFLKKLLLSHIKVFCKYSIPQDLIPVVIIHNIVARQYWEKTPLGEDSWAVLQGFGGTPLLYSASSCCGYGGFSLRACLFSCLCCRV